MFEATSHSTHPYCICIVNAVVYVLISSTCKATCPTIENPSSTHPAYVHTYPIPIVHVSVSAAVRCVYAWMQDLIAVQTTRRCLGGCAPRRCLCSRRSAPTPMSRRRPSWSGWPASSPWPTSGARWRCTGWCTTGPRGRGGRWSSSGTPGEDRFVFAFGCRSLRYRWEYICRPKGRYLLFYCSAY